MTTVIEICIFLAFLFCWGIFYFMLPEFLGKLLFAIFSIFIAKADIKTGAVPRLAFVFAFLFFFAFKLFLPGWNPLWESITGMLLGLLIFSIVFFVSKKKLGLADVWYSALIGMLLGPWWWYAAIGIACFTGVIYIIFFKKRRIPFIPFMAVGSITASIIQFFL